MGGKVEELWGKHYFVEKMSFELGMDREEVIDDDSGDEGNDEF